MPYRKVDNNGKEIIGNIGYDDLPPQYIHTQNNAISLWTIEHPLCGYPVVTCKNEIGNIIIGDVKHIDENTVTIEELEAIQANYEIINQLV